VQWENFEFCADLRLVSDGSGVFFIKFGGCAILLGAIAIPFCAVMLWGTIKVSATTGKSDFR
jgi:hypothetical protein